LKQRLEHISTIQFGFYSNAEDHGDVAYILGKHLIDRPNLSTDSDSFISLTPKSYGHLLADGDVLLVGKGQRNLAWTYRDIMGPAVASSIFFVIKPNKDQLLSDYLTILFNTPRMQAHFRTIGAGSSMPSIRKSELGATRLEVPALELQQQIIRLHQQHQKEMALTKQIINEKEKRYHALISQMIYQD